MATRSTHNKNNSGSPRFYSSLSRFSLPYSAVKRILQEARELANDPSTDYVAAPLEVRSLVRAAATRSLIPYCRRIYLCVL